MDNYSYIQVDTEFNIVQAIPSSVTGNTVTIEVRRLSDDYTWDFTLEVFEDAVNTGAMTFIYDTLWKQAFTPPEEDTYIITIINVTLGTKYTQVLIATGTPTPASIETRTTNSDISICNLALAHLGQKPITSLTEATESARALNRIYEISRDVVLRAKDWKFATVKAALVEVSDEDVPGWVYVYAYPSKCLCVRKIFDDIESKDPQKLEYEVMYIPSIGQKVICCDSEDAYIEYTYQLSDSTIFDVSLINAFSFLLAAQVGKPLTGNDDIAKLMLQIYGNMVSDAGRVNDGEKYIKPAQTSSFEDSR
jgi:hypothetical protein